MADKTWVASDLKMGILRLQRADDLGKLSVLHGYEYVDSNGDVIEDLPSKTYSEMINYTSLPVDIKEALLKIFNFTYQQALIDEGMHEV